MAFEDINHPALWGIQHIPSGKLLRQQTKGYGHTQLDVEDSPDSHETKERIVLPPRLFTSEEKAKRALTLWLSGSWKTELEFESTDEYGSGFYYRDSPIPIKKHDRVKEDMRVVPIYLYTDAKEKVYV